MTVRSPWERIGVVVTGPHPRSSKGNVYIISAIDHFTKYAFAMPVRNHDATTVARFLVDKFFVQFGVPRQLLSDRSAEFEGKIMKELCEVMGIDKLRTTSYHASCNGSIKRFHRTLNSVLGKVVSDNHRDWDEHVSYALGAYRATKDSATGFSLN